MSTYNGKKILIVGAGFGQVPAILKAKALGIYTIVIDKNPNALGMTLADEAFEVDIIDKEAALKVAKSFNVDGVMTMQTDLPIPTIGYINDVLNLSGVTYQTAVDCSHKTQTRLKLKTKQISQPDFSIVTTVDAAIEAAESIGYPVIVKAVDSSGSRGVTKVTESANVESAFKEALSYSRQENVLVEDYIDGIEIGAQAFSVNGKCVSVLVHNDTLSQPPYMIPTGHSFPSFLEDSELDYAVKAVKECVEALEIKEGPSNIDLIFDKRDGKAKIIEVGARIGATCLPELVAYHTGIDWVEATILNALGLPVNLNPSSNQAVAAEILEAPEDGILKDIIIPDEVQSHPNLLELEVTVSKGDTVSKLRKGTDRIGKIVVSGDTYKDAEALAIMLKSKITFKVEAV